MKIEPSIELICMDMDGTLFAGSETVPEINVRALRKCAEKGIHLALVSGRNYRFLMDKAAGIVPGLTIVSGNGTRIDECVGGKCLMEKTFDREEALYVSRILYGLDVYYEAYTSRNNSAFRPERITPVHERSLARYLKNRQILGCEYPSSPETACYEGVYKFVTFSDDPKKIEQVRNVLDQNGTGHSSSAADNVEVMPRGTDKGSALRFLKQHWQIDRMRVMAFGDYTNDLSMLAEAGWPVAMENGVEELKRKARIIAPHHMDGGVGRVIEKYVLGEA